MQIFVISKGRKERFQKKPNFSHISIGINLLI